MQYCVYYIVQEIEVEVGTNNMEILKLIVTSTLLIISVGSL